jgi:DNA-binding response OmpR family regulator
MGSVSISPHRWTGNEGGGATPEPRGTRPPAPPERERKRVLLVDDDPHDRAIYGEILLYNGFDLVLARDGETARNLVARHLPDLIVLDLGLPDVSGLDLCGEIHGWRAPEGVPILVLSGYSERDAGARARARGCSEFIEKPASPVAVLHAVERHLGKALLAGEGTPPRILEAS